MYSGYGIASDGKDEWSFNNYTARNAIVLGVDSKSSSHSDNLKNDFFIFGEGPTSGINGKLWCIRKKN